MANNTTAAVAAALALGGGTVGALVVNFTPGNTLTAAQLNAVQQGKVDTSGGKSSLQTLVTPTIQGGTAPNLDMTQALAVPDGATNSVTQAGIAARAGIVPDDYKIAADGDDDAPSIVRAITQACASSLNRVTLLARHYTINSQIGVVCPVILSGQGWRELRGDASTASGTWLDIGAGFAGQADNGAPVYVHDIAARGTLINDIAFREPGQTAPGATDTTWAPVAYPPVIYNYNTEGYTGFHRLFMPGVYTGIYSINGGRTDIKELYGQFFKGAVKEDAETDVVRVVDVHDWPYWSGASLVMGWQLANGYSVALGRADSPFLDRIFAYGKGSGLYLYTGTYAIASGYTTGLQLGNISCDKTAHCLSANAAGITGQIGNIRTFGSSPAGDGIIPSTLDSSGVITDPGAVAILVGGAGQVSLQIGAVEARNIYQHALYGLNPSACSNVRIGSLTSDFTNSTATQVYLSGSTACSTTSYNQLFVGTPPSVLKNSAQTFLNANGTRVFFPAATQQD